MIDDAVIDKYTKDFHDIFEKANNYRNNINKLHMQGGAREAPAGFRITIAIAQKLKKSGTSGLVYKNLLQVGKLILDDAKKQLKTDDSAKAESLAMKLADNPNEYIKKIKDNISKTKFSSRRTYKRAFIA